MTFCARGRPAQSCLGRPPKAGRLRVPRISAEWSPLTAAGSLPAEDLGQNTPFRPCYKLDDLPGNADEAELQIVTLGAKNVGEQFQATTALVNTFMVNSDQTVATSALARG